MFPDHSLMPREALRLAALGMLAEAPATYGNLARDLRSFVSHIMGPSPEAMGASLELLRYEGLADQAAGGDSGEEKLVITVKGRAELDALMQATVRSPFNDLNKLVVALKMRFLPLLSPAAQREQAVLLAEASRAELARLVGLCNQQAAAKGSAFVDWLEHDIAQAEERLAWFEALGGKLAAIPGDTPPPHAR
jgi:DNA-binding PadR family transcriptional regulator